MARLIILPATSVALFQSLHFTMASGIYTASEPLCAANQSDGRQAREQHGKASYLGTQLSFLPIPTRLVLKGPGVTQKLPETLLMLVVRSAAATNPTCPSYLLSIQYNRRQPMVAGSTNLKYMLLLIAAIKVQRFKEPRNHGL